MSLTVGSLFAGIGGFDLAAERVGFQVKWQVEIDDYATKVLEKHWPHVRRYRDIRRVLYPAKVDIICGGFPCQDISSAGRRAGISGKRSGLWRSMARAIRVVRPRYAFVENVAALLGRGMGTVLGDLAESGYDAEWDCIPASAVGAPHRRDRVWIVAYAARLQQGRQEQRAERKRAWSGRESFHVADANGSRLEGRDSQIVFQRAGKWPARTSDTSVPNADCGRFQEREELDGEPIEGATYRHSCRRHIDRCSCSGWWLVEPDVGRVANGVSSRVDRLRGLGNAIVPQVVEWIFSRIKEAEGLT